MWDYDRFTLISDFMTESALVNIKCYRNSLFLGIGLIKGQENHEGF